MRPDPASGATVSARSIEPNFVPASFRSNVCVIGVDAVTFGVVTSRSIVVIALIATAAAILVTTVCDVQLGS